MVSYGAEVFAFLDGRLDSRAPWVVGVGGVVVVLMSTASALCPPRACGEAA